MEHAEHRNFTSASEVREFPKARIEVIEVGGKPVGRATFEPGWRWSTSEQPFIGTKSCEVPHFLYHVSGVLKVQMDDGTELECRPGDVSLIPAGHDAWVVGDEPVVIVDFYGVMLAAAGK